FYASARGCCDAAKVTGGFFVLRSAWMETRRPRWGSRSPSCAQGVWSPGSLRVRAPSAGRRPSMPGCPHTPCTQAGLRRAWASGWRASPRGAAGLQEPRCPAAFPTDREDGSCLPWMQEGDAQSRPWMAGGRIGSRTRTFPAGHPPPAAAAGGVPPNEAAFPIPTAGSTPPEQSRPPALQHTGILGPDIHMETDMAGRQFRIEHDSMGELQVPADALWGASTQRAVENFPVSGRPMPRGFIRALGLVKAAAAD